MIFASKKQSAGGVCAVKLSENIYQCCVKRLSRGWWSVIHVIQRSCLTKWLNTTRTGTASALYHYFRCFTTTFCQWSLLLETKGPESRTPYSLSRNTTWLTSQAESGWLSWKTHLILISWPEFSEHTRAHTQAVSKISPYSIPVLQCTTGGACTPFYTVGICEVRISVPCLVHSVFLIVQEVCIQYSLTKWASAFNYSLIINLCIQGIVMHQPANDIYLSENKKYFFFLTTFLVESSIKVD